VKQVLSMISHDALAELIPLMHRLRAQIHEERDVVDEEFDCSSLSDALVHAESLYDDFDELEIVKSLKAAISGHIGDSNMPTLSSIERSLIESGTGDEAATRELIDNACNHVAASITDQVHKNNCVDDAISCLGDNLLNTKLSSYSKKKSSGGNYFSSFNFDDLPEYEPLEMTLERLRSDPCDEEMLNKLFEMDVDELMEHPQWSELLNLLSKSLLSVGDSRIGNVEGRNNSSTRSATELSILVQLRFMFAFSGQQSLDIIQHLLAYLMECWVKGAACINDSMICNVGILKSFPLQRNLALCVQTFVKILEDLPRHLSHAATKDVDKIIATVFIILTHGYVTVDPLGVGSSDCVPMCVDNTGLQTTTEHPTRCVPLLDIVCTNFSQEMSGFFQLLPTKHAPVSVLSHALHSGLYILILNCIRRESHGGSAGFYSKVCIWSSILIPFRHKHDLLELLSTLECREAVRDEPTHFYSGKMSTRAECYADTDDESSRGPESDSTLCGEMEIGPKDNTTGGSNQHITCQCKVVNQRLVLPSRTLCDQSPKSHEHISNQQSSSRTHINCWNGLCEGFTKRSIYSEPTSDSRDAAPQLVLPMMDAVKDTNRRFYVLSGSTSLLDMQCLLDSDQENASASKCSKGVSKQDMHRFTKTLVQLVRTMIRYAPKIPAQDSLATNAHVNYESEGLKFNSTEAPNQTTSDTPQSSSSAAVYSVKSCQQLSRSHSEKKMRIEFVETDATNVENTERLANEMESIRHLSNSLRLIITLASASMSKMLIECIRTLIGHLLEAVMAIHDVSISAACLGTSLLDRLSQVIINNDIVDTQNASDTSELVLDHWIDLVVSTMISVLQTSSANMQDLPSGALIDADVSSAVIDALTIVSSSDYLQRHPAQSDRICGSMIPLLQQVFRHLRYTATTHSLHESDTEKSIKFIVDEMHEKSNCPEFAVGMYTRANRRSQEVPNKIMGRESDCTSLEMSSNDTLAMEKFVGLCASFLGSPELCKRVSDTSEEGLCALLSVVMEALCDETFTSTRVCFDDPSESLQVDRDALVDSIMTVCEHTNILANIATEITDKQCIVHPFGLLVMALRREVLSAAADLHTTCLSPIARLIFRISELSYEHIGLAFSLISAGGTVRTYVTDTNRKSRQNNTKKTLGTRGINGLLYTSESVAQIFEQVLFLQCVPASSNPMWPILLQQFFMFLQNQKFCEQTALCIHERLSSQLPKDQKEMANTTCEWMFGHGHDDLEETEPVSEGHCEGDDVDSSQLLTHVCMENALYAYAKFRLQPYLHSKSTGGCINHSDQSDGLHACNHEDIHASINDSMVIPTGVVPQTEAEVEELAEFISRMQCVTLYT
jgi:hypothetical protein